MTRFVIPRKVGLMVCIDRKARVERRGPILCLQIHVTASFNQLLRDGRMPYKGREVERRGPTRVLGVDQGQRVCRRQQSPNSHCITITRSSMHAMHCFDNSSIRIRPSHPVVNFKS
jgi:hypothetical protein